MRQGRYKKNLLTPDQCPAFAAKMGPIALQLQQRHMAQEISDPELVAQFILSATQLIKPRNWCGSRRQSGMPGTALENFECFVLRGLPLSVNRSLIGWNAGEYPLRLFFEVPSIDQVLHLQSQGIRCVTVLLKQSELANYVLQERDPVSFTLHDLIHADHFFRDPRQACVQVGFSRWLSELWRHQSVRDHLERSATFARQFEYACADMNSHGAHLVKYLKAIFCQNQLQELLLELSRLGPRTLRFQQALLHLNTTEEQSSHLMALEEEFLKLGSSNHSTLENGVSVQSHPEELS
jgi:hypothetical protein